ncbi:MAG TPA: cytochrome c3 family protein [Steroidobacteraceae bacterium]|nr:cytochrome c3 family protein [Steroidobacteraceae bacterium]
MSAKTPPPHFRRLLGVCTLLGVLLLWPAPAAGGLTWDTGIAAGYVAAAFAMVLYMYPLRGVGLRGGTLPHRRLLTVSQHRRFGWIALGLAALHVLIALVAQPLTLHYLLPSAPLYMLCGVGALAVLGILVPTGLATRTAMRRTPARSSVGIVHAVLAALFLGLLGAHLVGSGQAIDTVPKAVSLCVLLALPAFWLVLRARNERLHARHWAALGISCAAAALLLVLPVRPTSARLMEPLARPVGSLPVHFPHELHMSVNCVTCHHNFRDGTGTANCIDCHRSSRADLPHSSEATFHIFCRQCHHDLALEGRKHGPTRNCQMCHH